MLGCSYTTEQSVAELFVSFWVKNDAQAAATIAYTTAGKCSLHGASCAAENSYTTRSPALLELMGLGGDASLHVGLHLIKTWLGHLCLGCLAAPGLGFVRAAPLSAGWVVCRAVHVFVHTGVDLFTYPNHQWEFRSWEGGISLLGCLSWGRNTSGSVLLWPEQDILKNTWFSLSTIFKFQILNPFFDVCIYMLGKFF